MLHQGFGSQERTKWETMLWTALVCSKYSFIKTSTGSIASRPTLRPAA